MNLDEIQNAWNSPRNKPQTAEQQQLAQRFIRQMIRRRRFQAIWLTNTFVWLTLVTLWLGMAIGSGTFDFAQEWALLPLLIAPWLVALRLLRRYGLASSAAKCAMPVTDSLRAALASLQTERSNLRLVAVLLAGMIPIVALAVQQLHAVGKVSPEEQACMAVLFGGALLAGVLGVAVRYFGRVLPQVRRLNALLSEIAG